MDRWLERAAAFIILWFVLALILGVLIAAMMRAGGARRVLPPGDSEDGQP